MPSIVRIATLGIRQTDGVLPLKGSRSPIDGHSYLPCRSFTWQDTIGISILSVIVATRLFYWIGFPWDRRATFCQFTISSKCYASYVDILTSIIDPGGLPFLIANGRTTRGPPRHNLAIMAYCPESVVMTSSVSYGILPLL